MSFCAKNNIDCAENAFQIGLLDPFKTGNIVHGKESGFTFIDLFAGFPYQPFSITGHRQGFNDKNDRGYLFFNIVKILKEKNKSLYIREYKKI